MSTSLRNNVVANAFGQGWKALMNLAFVPLYIKFLGIEAYGLMGLFAVLQAWLGLLDMGMKPTLGREMARFTGGEHDSQSIRTLLRSIEVIGAAIAAVIALGVWAVSGWLATSWLHESKLPASVAASAFSMMGGVIALRFLEDIYVSGLAGLQRQVEQNVITSLVSAARGLGAVAVLAWISPTITAFFLWQGVVSVVSVVALAMSVYRLLPPSPNPARFSSMALIAIWRFAAGMMTITLLSLLLTQVDKILLSRLLPLETFGYYVLAGTAVSGLYALIAPITSAFYPRFTTLAAQGDQTGLSDAYHRGAELVSVLMGSAAVVLMIFGARVLALWTGDPVLTERVAPLLIVLALGTLFNGLMWVPYQMMLAHGWTTLSININIIAVVVFGPTLWLVVPRFGALGAAWIWFAINAASLAVIIPLLHRRLLRGEQWRWYGQDVAIPLAAATVTALVCRWILPNSPYRIREFCLLAVASCSVLFASALAAPGIRQQIGQYMGFLRSNAFVKAIHGVR